MFASYCFLGLFCPLSVAAPAAEEPGARRWEVTVKETAGIRRFGYPVGTVLELQAPAPDAEHFVLLENGKPIVAQFRPVGDSSRGVRAVALNFNVSHAPLETRSYVIEYDPRRPPPAARKGLRVVADGDGFRVVHPADLEFAVPRDLRGLLAQVRSGKNDYLRPGSAGLVVRAANDTDFRAADFGSDGGPAAARVAKEGPLAVTLRWEGTLAARDNRKVPSVVEMDFPISKSWVRVTWTVNDPDDRVAALAADLNLNVDGKQTLVDFGAGTYVYARLRAGEGALLRQEGSSWRTLLGKAGSPTPYVIAAPGAPPAEGWAHVMDDRRCTAVAVEDFARPGNEKGRAEIRVDADGRLRVSRSGVKRLRFWLHFVPVPVQVGAATSPQAMLAPLRVAIGPEK